MNEKLIIIFNGAHYKIQRIASKDEVCYEAMMAVVDDSYAVAIEFSSPSRCFQPKPVLIMVVERRNGCDIPSKLVLE